MKSVLITGGTGFFGKSILDYFSRHDCPYEFAILSRHSGDIVGDVRTFTLPPDAHFDYVIHAATPARADVPDDEMRSIIIDGTANAISQAEKCGATKFMMVSSGGVYGKGFSCPISEDDEPHPFTAYGHSKLLAEQMAINSGLYTLIPRCFAFVGRYLDRNAHFAIGNFIRDALAGKDIVINGDGSPMRSYMYADDLVEWLFAILERGASGRPYNVGSPDAISIRNLAQAVISTIQSNKQTISNIKILGAPVPGAANFYVPVVYRAMKELGLSIKHNLPEALMESVK